MLSIRLIDGPQVRPVEVGDLEAALAGPGYVWIDLQAPTETEEAILESPTLGIEEMAVEDIREDRHLPKVDVGEDQFLLVVHGLVVDDELVEITTSELDVVMKSGLLVTFHREPMSSVSTLRERVDAGSEARIDRPVQLLHRVLDLMNEVIVPVLDMLDRRLDYVEEDILTEPTEDTRREIYGLQRDLIQLRRAAVPQAEVIRRLGRDPIGLLADEDRALFRDLYDHLFRVAELSSSYQQLLDNAMDSYRSALDDNLNDMLTTLTMISALLLPISVIAGIYGTNFAHIPELDWRFAYPTMWGVFVLIVVGQLAWFRSRGWIGQRTEQEARRRRAALGDIRTVRVLGRVLKTPAYGARAVASTGRRFSRLVRGRRHDDDA